MYERAHTCPKNFKLETSESAPVPFAVPPRSVAPSSYQQGRKRRRRALCVTCPRTRPERQGRNALPPHTRPSARRLARPPRIPFRCHLVLAPATRAHARVRSRRARQRSRPAKNPWIFLPRRPEGSLRTKLQVQAFSLLLHETSLSLATPTSSRPSAQSILQLQRNAARATLVEHKELTESSNGGEGCRCRRAAQGHHRQGQPSAVVVSGGQPAAVPHPVSQVPVPVGHQGEAREDQPRRRAEGGADHPGSGHRQHHGGEATPAGRSGQRGSPAASGVRGHQEAGAPAVRGDVAGPDAASLGQGRRGRRPPGHRQMPVLHAHRRRRVAPRLSPMLPRGLWHCSAVLLLAVPCHVADDRSRRDHQASHRSIRHVPDRHRPAHVRHGDVRHVLRLPARPGAHLREAEERGEDPVRHAGQVEVRPRRHPAAPGRRPREVQERAARHRPRHGLLRRGGARLLRRRLPAVQALGASAATQQASLLRVNVSNVPAA